jgi:HK97 family phage portal protein
MNFIQKAAIKLLGLNQSMPMTFQYLNGIVTWSGQDARAQVNDGYRANDIVYSVVRLIVEKAKVAPWNVYKIKDKRAYKLLVAELEKKNVNHKRVDELSTKALEIYENDQRLNELLKYPNKEDSWSDLIEGWGTYKLVTGNAYVAATLIEAGANKGKPLEIYNLPAQFTQIKAVTDQLPAVKTGYQVNIGPLYYYDLNEVLHDKYFNPDSDATGRQLYGMSPLEAASKNLTRSNEAKTAAVALLQNGGPAGVLFAKPNKDMGYDGAAAKAQVNSIRNQMDDYTGAAQKNRISVSGWEVGYQSIGLSNVDLAIIESEKHDLRSICNVYGVPSTLLNAPDAKTENNQTAAEKALTARAAIPLLTSMATNFNRQLETHWGYGGQDIVVMPDMSVYTELQEDKATQVAWLKDSMLPLRRRYEIMGEPIPEYLEEDMLNSIFVNGMQVEPSINAQGGELLDPYAKS